MIDIDKIQVGDMVIFNPSHGHDLDFFEYSHDRRNYNVVRILVGSILIVKKKFRQFSNDSGRFLLFDVRTNNVIETRARDYFNGI